MTGKDIISIYSPEAPFPVYEPDAWFGDGWDGMDYGQDYDFSRPFFEQWLELFNKVPKMALHVMNLENSPYVNQVWYAKNCHLCFDLGFSENCLYCYMTYHCKDTMDCTGARNCELCYGLMDCTKCYGCVRLQDCGNCYDSFFSYDCRGCSNVAFCWNLRNKKYHIFNRPVSKEEWNDFMAEMREGSREKFAAYEHDFKEKVLQEAMHRASHNVNTENCSGDYILNSQNCNECFDCADSQDMNKCTRMDEQGKDCMDIDGSSILELGYEGSSMAGTNVKFGSMSLYCDDAMYFHTLQSCSNCFGCAGLKNKKYCILNKQYTQEKYEAMMPRIIEHMKSTGEWGENFPAAASPFPYNDSYANERFPMTQEEVLAAGLRWRDKDAHEYKAQTYVVPDRISDVADEICGEILACEITGKNFRVIPQELAFYKQFGLPIPQRCPDQRHADRFAMRSPYQIVEQACGKCGGGVQSSHPVENGWKVYCEECYLKEVY